ncbi:MAG TPA: 3-deoxy-D-manno-octulosonic acid transferase [Candidatus Eisenbacteria bacterium]|nr:3-deoxy-D-manno-octulosonic acid transferase [Candidatus Eisenbacteria bacterium]
MYLFYSFLMALAAIVTSPYWLIQGLRHSKYLSNLFQRLGLSISELDKLPADRSGAIWIHAVSVGEALSGVTLARRLKDAYPERPLIISTTTQTGYALAKERMPFADAVVYFPLDWAFCVRRVLDAAKPAVVVILETEIWPNFLRESALRNIPVLFVSGRISDRSFTRWQSYLGSFGFYLRPLLQSALSHAAAFLMQTQQDADRIKALGAPADRVFVSGNLKYDQQLPAPTPLAQWLEQECQRRDRRPLIVAGSVAAAEEPLALIVFGVVQGDFPKALLVLAPRKPERFAAAAEFIEESHRKFVRRSELALPGPGANPAPNGNRNSIPDDASVVLLDSIGELASLYRLADGVFVGGSLVNSGGHNILEPAAFGKVPIFGPSMENFAAMAARFVESQAAIQVESPEDAGVEMIHLLQDPEKMRRMGGSAKQLVETSRGALDRAFAEISRHLGGSAQ